MEKSEALRSFRPYPNRVWVASEIHDVPVGMVITSVGDGAAYIEEMDVLPAHGTRGLGTLLLDRVYAWTQA